MEENEEIREEESRKTMLTKAPKGTKDILPSEVYKWRYIETCFREIMRRHGFQEIRTPMFEGTDLFNRGVGETSDIVNKEMYTFEDRGKRSITLKPEGTSPVVRAYIENKEYTLPKPRKYYYITPCFRYERPQAGRLREFHQLGCEIFGAEGMQADADVIACADDFLHALGIQDLRLHLNSIGKPRERETYREALRAYFRPHQSDLCPDCQDRFDKNPMRLLDCKVKACQAIAAGAPIFLDYLDAESARDFQELQTKLKAMDIAYTVDPRIVRGLDYYSKTAFEFMSDRIGAQGTICGGGRYDSLVEEIGGPDIPGVGFGIGIERLLLLMEAEQIPIPQEEPADAFLICLGGPAEQKGLRLAKSLRRKGLAILMDDLERGLKAQMKGADRSGASYAIIIGEDELEKGVAVCRDMRRSTQEEVPFDALYARIKEER